MIECLICPKCESNFLCGRSEKACWCQSMTLSHDTLTKLQKEFKGCLCPHCLEQYSDKTNERENLSKKTY
jgi:hypothetical protein